MIEKKYTDVKKLIDNSDRILIISHKKPDADTLGSAIVLKLWLVKIKKHVTLACVDRPSVAFSFLPDIDNFVNEFDITKFDLIIIVDSGASYITNFHLKYKEFFASGIPILNIDHHSSNDNFGTVNLVDPNSASTTIIIYKMFLYFKVSIDSDMALAFLAGIYGDTGSFMHSNTTAEVYNVAADLMLKGAKIADIIKSLFNNKSIPTLKLWGKVFENSYVTSENVVVSVIRESDYSYPNADIENLSGVVDYLNMVPSSKFAVLINEDRRGNVKGSFRTRLDNVDLSKVASFFGGGGHPKASGFSIKGKLKEEKHYLVVSDGDEKKSLEFLNKV